MKEKRRPKMLGYAHVSTDSQELRLQLDALRKAGCAVKDTFMDKMSGATSARPGLEQCLSQLKPGDILVVWRLDRLGRSVRDLTNIVEGFGERGVGLKSLCDGAIDTTTASAKLIFHIFTALAEFERSLIQERTKAGLTAARARGRLGGRRPISPDHPKVVTARALHSDKNMPVRDICRTLRISRARLYRYVGKHKLSA